MIRLLLVLAVLIGATASVPQLRSRTAPIVAPAAERAAPLIDAAWTAVRQPVIEWLTRHDAKTVAQILRQRAVMGYDLPQAHRLEAFLREHSDVRVDRWGRPFFLLGVSADSIHVGSAGPDGERGTEDDISVGISRR